MIGFLKQWQPFVLGAVVASVATMVVGFKYGGWETSGTTAKMVADARTDALVPICVAKAQKDPSWDSGAAFMKENYYNRDSFVEKAGWATFSGSDSPDSAVAAACASKLVDVAKPPA